MAKYIYFEDETSERQPTLKCYTNVENRLLICIEDSFNYPQHFTMDIDDARELVKIIQEEIKLMESNTNANG